MQINKVKGMALKTTEEIPLGPAAGLEEKLRDISPEHDYALDTFIRGDNLLLTGLSGTGKTHYSKQILEWSRASLKNCLVTGTTGASALLMQGQTIHSLIGLRPDESDVSVILKKCSNQLASFFHHESNHVVLDRPGERIKAVREAHVLFIDECSMLSAWMLELVDIIFRLWRQRWLEVMGGIQVVFVGDFDQLLPVPSKFNQEETKKHCFLSPVWDLLQVRVCNLQKVFRQVDPSFLQLIQSVGNGQTLTHQQLAMLQKRSDACLEKDQKVLEIMIRNDEVRRVNNLHYQELPSKSYIYPFPLQQECFAQPEVLYELVSNVKDCLQMHDLTNQRFCIGARVMLRMNLKDLDLVNGHTGTIVDFEVRMITLGEKPEKMFFPKIQWDHGACSVIEPYTFERNDYSIRGHSFIQRRLARVVALPLVLCWAMTVHKVQGQTISNCALKVNCNGMEWMCATFYVALSRVCSLDQIYLQHFKNRFRANPQAVSFYSKLTLLSIPDPSTFMTSTSFSSNSTSMSTSTSTTSDSTTSTSTSDSKTSSSISTALVSTHAPITEYEMQLQSLFESLNKGEKRKR